MDVTKHYRFIWFGNIHGPKPYEFTRSRPVIISHTPVSPSHILIGGATPAAATRRVAHGVLVTVTAKNAINAVAATNIFEVNKSGPAALKAKIQIKNTASPGSDP